MILIAPDSFKGTYSAREVASAIMRGIRGPVDLCPVADGGEGTLEIVIAARQGTTTEVFVHDPLGRLVSAPIGWIDRGSTAIVEMASASGISLVALPERDAELASTYGTGELLIAARAAGARRIVLTAGGSATTDGGKGAIDAIEQGGGLVGAELLIACDVTTPFERAAEVYAAQKGADGCATARLTRRLEALGAALPRDPRGMPFTGAAGGLAGGLWAMYGARLTSGASWVLDAVSFDARLMCAEAVVTGEGRIDHQSFEGKLVGEIVSRCRSVGKPVHAVVGRSELDATHARALGLTSIHLASDEPAMEAVGPALRHESQP